MATGSGIFPTMHPVAGFKLGTASAGIKTPGRADLVVMEIPANSSVAGLFTQNAFCAAPVTLCKQHLAAASPRYFLTNTGNANACNTGVNQRIDTGWCPTHMIAGLQGHIDCRARSVARLRQCMHFGMCLPRGVRKAATEQSVVTDNRTAYRWIWRRPYAGATPHFQSQGHPPLIATGHPCH